MHEHAAVCALAHLIPDRSFRLRCVLHQVSRPPLELAQMTTAQVVFYCLSAWGIGYAAGHTQLIFRKAIEHLD